MQTATSTLTNAILAQERLPVQKVEVDWDRDGYGGTGTIDDLTPDVVSISIDRSLSTDLPAEVKLFTGYSTAEATVALSRQVSAPTVTSTALPYDAPIAYDAAVTYDGSGFTSTPGPLVHTTYYYSPFNSNSPLFGKRRMNAPVRISLGFAGTAGPEYLVVFTGRVRSIEIDAANREVTMTLGDLAETMRKQVSLPMVIADGETASTTVSPGLNTTFLADYVARQCGYNASPPQRSNVQVSATMHGSGYPEVGSIQNFHGANNTMLAFSPTSGFPAPAKWVMALNKSGSDLQICSYVLSNQTAISTNNTDACFFEAWVRFNQIGAADQAIMMAFRTGVAVPYVSLWVDTSGRLQSNINRGGSDTVDRSTGVSGPSGFAANTWYYIAAYWAFTSSGTKVWLRKDGSTTGPITVGAASVTNAPRINTLYVGRGSAGSFADAHLDGLIEAVQFTSENSGTSNPPAFNDAFTPTATVMPDEANMVATPPTLKTEAWSILQQLAAAEFATVGFDEVGMFTYLTRKRWMQAPYNQVQRTLDSRSALKELQSREAVDQIRNHVVARAVVPKVIDFTQIWIAGTRYQVQPGGDKTIFMDLDNPCTNIDTVFNYSTDGSLGSRYLAGTQRDGGGSQVSNLTFTTTILSPQKVKVVIHNPNGFVVWITADSDAPGIQANQVGKPYLVLFGQQVMFETVTNPTDTTLTGSSVVSSDAQDATSISQYGEQLLELDDNPFRQDPDQVERLANDLLAQLKNPKPVLPSVDIVGDPRLQLGDRDTLSDPDGLILSRDFAISAVNTTFDASGLGQSIGVRAT